MNKPTAFDFISSTCIYCGRMDHQVPVLQRPSWVRFNGSIHVSDEKEDVICLECLTFEINESAIYDF